ncbi:glycosyltransferase [Sphingomonas sp.]|uniref:glycosyltransferase n=1 Tax=Sphingomonas sp. TaxID=28214 RepID=UPI003D6C9ADB
MLRVAHLLPNLVIGGRERIVADLCRDAPDDGIDPFVIAYDPAADPAGQFAVEAPVIAVDRRDPGFARQLRDWLTDARIDVLHAQGHVSAALARRGLGDVPMVATLHIALGTGWRWALPVARGLRAAREVTAVSDDLARRYRPLAGRPIRTIATGVDLGRFAARERTCQSDRSFTLGIAARLHPVKRHQDALAALRILQERGLSCRLEIAGDGPRAAELARLAQDLDVRLLGTVTDMPGWLATLDGFMLVSDHEGTPAALIEAMAASLPCIATRVGGMPALAGDAALLVPRRSPRAIADAIERLIRDPGLRRDLANAARDRAAQFGTDRQSSAYREIYRQCVAGPHHLHDKFVIQPPSP